MFWVENLQGRAPGCLDCMKPAQALYGGAGGQHGPLFDASWAKLCSLVPQQTPYSVPAPHTPTPPGLATPFSQALKHSLSGTAHSWVHTAGIVAMMAICNHGVHHRRIDDVHDSSRHSLSVMTRMWWHTDVQLEAYQSVPGRRCQNVT